MDHSSNVRHPKRNIAWKFSPHLDADVLNHGGTIIAAVEVNDAVVVLQRGIDNGKLGKGEREGVIPTACRLKGVWAYRVFTGGKPIGRYDRPERTVILSPIRHVADTVARPEHCFRTICVGYTQLRPESLEVIIDHVMQPVPSSALAIDRQRS